MAGVKLRHSFDFIVSDENKVVPFIIVPGNNQRLNVRSIHINAFDVSGNKGAIIVEQMFFSDIGAGYLESSPVLEDSQYDGGLNVKVHVNEFDSENPVTNPIEDRTIGSSIIAANNSYEIFAALNERDGFSIPGGDHLGDGKHRFGLSIYKVGLIGDIRVVGYMRFEY